MRPEGEGFHLSDLTGLTQCALQGRTSSDGHGACYPLYSVLTFLRFKYSEAGSE